MPKFNTEKLKELNLRREAAANPEFKVGAGLLNESSKSQAIDMKVEYLNREDILKNEKNQYSIEDINSLAWSISNTGLIQPLHVKRIGNGKYKLLGGERRLTAIDQLIGDPDNTKWTKDSRIPCVVKDPEEIDLPLSRESKEAFSIITTNKESRNYTDADRMMEIREWKKIISELRDNGVESIPFANENGTEDELVIKGEKTRDLLSRTTGLSRGMINKYENVENHASEELKEAILMGKTSINTADEIVKNMNIEEQKDFLKNAEKDGVEITPQEIKNQKVTEHPEVVSAERFKRDLKDITKYLRKAEVCLTDEEQMRYDECIRTLKSILYKE